jgi:Arc/MetJ-type ribon-helix-helix transcriptional regulator
MSRLNISINDELLEDMDYQLGKKEYKNRSEFIEKALLFYLGYLQTGNSKEYLNQSVVAGVRQGINDIEKQTMPNIFRLSVELSMLMNVIASAIDVTPEQLKRLRSDCVRAIRATKRRCSFENSVKYQNGYPLKDEFFKHFSGQLEIEEETYDIK